MLELQMTIFTKISLLSKNNKTVSIKTYSQKVYLHILPFQTLSLIKILESYLSNNLNFVESHRASIL